MSLLAVSSSPTPTTISYAPPRRTSLATALGNAIDGDLGDSVLDLFVRVAVLAEVFFAVGLVMSA